MNYTKKGSKAQAFEKVIFIQSKYIICCNCCPGSLESTDWVKITGIFQWGWVGENWLPCFLLKKRMLHQKNATRQVGGEAPHLKKHRLKHWKLSKYHLKTHLYIQFWLEGPFPFFGRQNFVKPNIFLPNIFWTRSGSWICRGTHWKIIEEEK